MFFAYYDDDAERWFLYLYVLCGLVSFKSDDCSVVTIGICFVFEEGNTNKVPIFRDLERHSKNKEKSPPCSTIDLFLRSYLFI